MPRRVYFIYFILFFGFLSSVSAVCVNDGRIESIEYSLDDDSFSFDYDGDKGVIQRIYFDQPSSSYLLWQTNLLGKDYSRGDIFNVESGSFNIDSNFNSNKNQMLIINKNSSNFNLYVKLTVKYTGDCFGGTGELKVKNSNSELNYYGYDLKEAHFDDLNLNPSSNSEISSLEYGDLGSNIFQFEAKDLLFGGVLSLDVSPYQAQDLQTFFAISGPNDFCGNGIIGYFENCDGDDSNLGYACKNSCIERHSIPNNGKITAEYYLRGVRKYYIPREGCDPNIIDNKGNSLICNADNTKKISTCGNGVIEVDSSVRESNGGSVWAYFSPAEECEIGDENCNSNCKKALSRPSVKIYNTYYGSDLYDRGVTSVNVSFRIYNPNEEPINVTFVSIHAHHYSLGKLSSYSHLRFYEGELGDFRAHNVDPSFSVIIPANSSLNFVKELSTGFDKVDLDKLFYSRALRFLTYYKFSNLDESLNFGNFGAWSDWNADGYFGSPIPQHSFDYLKPNLEKFVLGVSEDGIPKISIGYDKASVKSYKLKSVPSNAFYFNVSLNEDKGGVSEEVRSYISFHNKSYQRNDLGYIPKTPNLEKYPELEMKEDFEFLLEDFEKYNGKSFFFDLKPYYSRTDFSVFNYNSEYKSVSKKFDLDVIKFDVDNPIEIRPNGNKGYDELYSRILYFNYKDYTLFNVSIDLEVVDNNGNNFDNLFDISYNNNLKIPAGASFPIYFKIKYKGLSPIEDKNYKVILRIKYTNPNTNEVTLSDQRILTLKLLKYDVSDSETFVDLIPYNLNFSLLNIDNLSRVNVDIANQGNKNSQGFFVKFYSKDAETNQEFKLIDSSYVSQLEAQGVTKLSFDFIPENLAKQVLKVVVDEENNVLEEDFFVRGAKINNVITSVAMVRDIDVVLEYVRPLYDEAENGVIPFEVFAKNKGFGGIDDYEIKIILNWEGYTYSKSFYFYSIPEEGYVNKFYWNVSDVNPQVYVYNATLNTIFDPYLKDNTVYDSLTFCPLPWFSGVHSCYEVCDFKCVNKITNRYQSSCRGINGCEFYDDSFAHSCSGYTIDSYAKFNETHRALCPDARITKLNQLTQERLNISSKVCDNLIIDKYNTFFKGEAVILNFVTCG